MKREKESLSEKVINVNGKPLVFDSQRVNRKLLEMAKKSKDCEERGGHTSSGRYVYMGDRWKISEYCAHCGFIYERRREKGDPRTYVTFEDLQKEITI